MIPKYQISSEQASSISPYAIRRMEFLGGTMGSLDPNDNDIMILNQRDDCAIIKVINASLPRLQTC
jgi:hypothetical protein